MLETSSVNPASTANCETPISQATINPAPGGSVPGHALGKVPSKEEALAILKPFLPRKTYCASCNTTVGGWEFRKRQMADDRRHVLENEYKNIEQFVLSKFENPAAILAEIFSADTTAPSQASAYKEAFYNNGLDSSDKTFTSETLGQQIKVADLLSLANEAIAASSNFEKTEVPFWKAIDINQNEKILPLFGLTYESAIEEETPGYKCITHGKVKQLVDYAKNAWGLKLEFAPLWEALGEMRASPVPSLEVISAQSLSALESKQLAMSRFTAKLAECGEIPNTLASLTAIDAILGVFAQSSNYRRLKENSVKELEELGDLGQGRKMAQIGKEILQAENEVFGNLWKKKELILTDRITRAFKTFFGDTPTSQNQILKEALSASIKIAASQLGDSSCRPVQLVREESLLATLREESKDLKTSSRHCAGIQEGDDNLTQEPLDEDTCWHAAALFALHEAVTSVMAKEIDRIQNKRS